MAVKSHMKIAPGLKVAAPTSPEPSDEEMAFVRQMGDDGRLGTADTLAYMHTRQKRAEEEVH